MRLVILGLTTHRTRWTGLLFSHAERDIAGQVKMLSQKREESNAQYEHSVVTVRAKGLTVICEQLMTALP